MLSMGVYCVCSVPGVELSSECVLLNKTTGNSVLTGRTDTKCITLNTVMFMNAEAQESCNGGTPHYVVVYF